MEKLGYEPSNVLGREQRNNKYSDIQISKLLKYSNKNNLENCVALAENYSHLFFENMYWMSQVYQWKKVYLPIYISALVQKILKVA